MRSPDHTLWSGAQPVSGSRQIVERQPDGHGAFADRGSDAVHRSGAYISGGEYTWHAGLQRHRFAGFLPRFRDPICQAEIVSGQNKALGVPEDRGRQPSAAGSSTDKYKHGIHSLFRNRIVFKTPEPDTFQPAL